MKHKKFRVFNAMGVKTLLACGLLTGVGCQSENSAYEPSFAADTAPKTFLLLGVPTQSFYAMTGPFVNYLNRRLQGVQIQTVASLTFNDYLHQLNGNGFDITIVNGIKALACENQGYSIIGKADNDSAYKGVIVVNADSAIHDFADLKNKTIASPGTEGLSGHMMPMLFLSRHGVDVNRDLRLSYYASYESVLSNVYLGKCAAGFSYIHAWKNFIKERPEVRSKLLLKWETPPLVNLALLFRRDMDPVIAGQLKKLLFSMHETEEGRKALALVNFTKIEATDSAAYFRPVKKFLKAYNAEVQSSN